MERSAVDRVVYLHGFRSSPASAKGRELAAAAAEWNADFSAPDLNLSPREADALVGQPCSRRSLPKHDGARFWWGQVWAAFTHFVRRGHTAVRRRSSTPA
mgnify:CR=1 FL=1